MKVSSWHKLAIPYSTSGMTAVKQKADLFVEIT
jgi:hypothetical protein